MQQKRIAIVGLYRSGSSMLASVLRALGVDLGERFWGDHCEEVEIAQQLRKWWDEPEIVESAPALSRQEWLAAWATRQEQRGARFIGAKHPLLSMCCSDLVEAWGEERTTILWIQRDLQASIDSLERIHSSSVPVGMEGTNA